MSVASRLPDDGVLRGTRSLMKAAFALAVLSGCLDPRYGALMRRADRLVAEGRGRVAKDQESARAGSKKLPPSESQEERDRRVAREVSEAYPNLDTLTLDETLRIATRYNREYESRRNGLIREALSLIQSRHAYEPRLSGAVSYLASFGKSNDPDSHSQTYTTSGSLGVDQLLPTGAKVSLSGSTGGTHNTWGDPDDTLSSSVRVSVSQPLLKGAGIAATMEPLTAAERSRIYALRQFEMFRQQFAIDAVRRYYNLVRQRQVIENTKRRTEQADFLYRRSQALFRVGRLPQLEVFRAEQDKLQAENDLRDAEQAFRDDQAQFRNFLGVPTDLPMDIRGDEQPDAHTVSMSADEAVQLAMDNRLDVMTARQSLEDAERALRLARRNLLPDLSLTASASASADSTGSFRGQEFDNFNVQAGISMPLPLDRLGEQIAYKNALLSLEQQQRSYSNFLAELRIGVRSRVRNIERSANSLKVQERIVQATRQRLTVAQIRFRQGDTSTRDLVETQLAVQDAENTYIRYRVDHVVAEMELQRDLGVLRIDEQGRPKLEKLP